MYWKSSNCESQDGFISAFKQTGNGLHHKGFSKTELQ